VAPAETPEDIIKRLHAEVTKALQDKELQHAFRAAGVEAGTMTPAELGEFIKTEHEKWGKLVRATGATVN
jgi:tripartite-type tricarboxylate transporter receptor subunit TctC